MSEYQQNDQIEETVVENGSEEVQIEGETKRMREDPEAEAKRRAELKAAAMQKFKTMQEAGSDKKLAEMVHNNAGVFTGGANCIGILSRPFKELKPGSKGPWGFSIILVSPEGATVPYDDPDSHTKGKKPEFPIKPKTFPVPSYKMEYLGTYSAKMFSPTNADMRVGTVVRLAGLQYSFYRKEAGKDFNFSLSCKSCVPEKLTFEDVVKAIPANLRGLNPRPFASHHNQMLEILGEVLFAELSHEYAPSPGYVFDVDQTMDAEKIGARIEAGEDNFTVVTAARLPVESECFKYEFNRGDKAKSYYDMALKGAKPLHPLLYTVFSVINGEVHTSGASCTLYREDIAQTGIVTLEDWEALGPNIVKGLKYCGFGCKDEQKSEFLDNPDEEVFESQMQLAVRAFMDVPSMVKNVGIRFPIEAARKLFLRLDKEELNSDADAEVRKYMNAREAIAVNLSGITGDVKALNEAAKNGEVEIYLVCNHNLPRSELATTDYETLFAKLEASAKDRGQNFVRKWYAISTNGKPILSYVKKIAADE